MKRRTWLALMVLAGAALLLSAAAGVSPPNVSATAAAGERIRFQITAVEESTAGRRVISDAAVEGPPGTDFNVNLQDGRFRVSARFLTDLSPAGPAGGLTLRARLDTRRLYGHSEAGLPLYEEDAQRHTLGLSFDEAVVILPFGGGGDAGRLSIEIKPARVGRVDAGDAGTPQITISKPSPGGAISIEAWKVPHDFVVEAELLEDGRAVARASADCLLEESRELPLRPAGAGDAAAPLVLDLSVERFEPGPGAGRAAVRFDLLKGDPGRAPLARNWAGVAALGSEMSYDLSGTVGLDAGKRYELRLRVNLAAGEGAGR